MRGNDTRLRLRREVDARRVPRRGTGAVDSLDSRRGAASYLALVAPPLPPSAGEARDMNSRLPKRSTVPGWKGCWRLPIWSLTGGCSSTCISPLPGAPTVGVSTPGGVPGPTSKLSPRALAQMGRRETEHEGGQERGRQAEKGKPAAFVLPCAQVGCACSRGLQASTWERERESLMRRPVLPRGQPSRTRPLDLPFIGVRRGSRCTMGGVAVC